MARPAVYWNYGDAVGMDAKAIRDMRQALKTEPPTWPEPAPIREIERVWQHDPTDEQDFRMDLYAVLLQVRRHLTKEQRIVSRMWAQGYTLEQIGARVRDKSRERARQILARAFRIMQHRFSTLVLCPAAQRWANDLAADGYFNRAGRRYPRYDYYYEDA